jgi:hypothetical protein
VVKWRAQDGDNGVARCGLAFALVVIACGGTAFMVRFLIAVLREGSPSVCYWVIPVVAAEGEERAQEVFETGLEFDFRISYGRPQVQCLGAGGW